MFQPYVAELCAAFSEQRHYTVKFRRAVPLETLTSLAASHIGATMMGEWKVIVDGKNFQPPRRLKNAPDPTPWYRKGKDGLGILSNNSIGMALTMNAVEEATPQKKLNKPARNSAKHSSLSFRRIRSCLKSKLIRTIDGYSVKIHC